jgi:hypothetical protein
MVVFIPDTTTEKSNNAKSHVESQPCEAIAFSPSSIRDPPTSQSRHCRQLLIELHKTTVTHDLAMASSKSSRGPDSTQGFGHFYFAPPRFKQDYRSSRRK